MLKQKMLLPLLITAVACNGGGGGGSGSSGKSGSIEAQFIDDPVKGLEFRTASGKSDKTKSQGKFNCKKGEKVTFSIAGLDLGEAICGEKIFVDDLVSDDPEHTPEQVAAIIQSFAIPGVDELDLSEALKVMDPEELKNVTFDKNNSSTVTSVIGPILAAVKSDLPAEVASNLPAAAMDPDNMRAILDSAIANYSNLADNFKSALSEVAHSPSLSYSSIPSNKIIKLTGKLISKDPNDECYDFVQARVSVSQEAAGKPFKLVVHKSASFAALDAYDSETNLCKDADWCDQGTSMPAPKLITSSSINFFTKQEYSNWESQTVAVLNGSVKNDKVLFSGTFQEDGSYEEDGRTGTFSCKYAVTSEEVAIPEEGPMSEHDDEYPHVDLPAEATGTFSMNADPIYCSEGTEALLAGGVLPASFDVAISGQNVVVSNTSSVDEVWTKDGSWLDDPQHVVYFKDTGKWHLDLTFNPDFPDRVGIYIYHKASGDYTQKYCSFDLARNP